MTISVSCVSFFSTLMKQSIRPYPLSTAFVASRNYALKSSLPIKWVRPEKIPCINPKKSGDLEPLKRINLDETLAYEFRDSEELKTADPKVKALFTLKYLPYSKTVEVLRHNYVDLVKRHNLDYNSVEARVARMTVDIRDMQNYMAKNPTNKRAKVRLKETIDKRKRLLKNIRSSDYKRFEWILEQLNLFYKPLPPYEVYKRIERKRSLRMLTKAHCEDIVNSRLAEYKTKLEEEQEDFLVKKLQTLEWIAKEEAECGVPATITEVDIQNCKESLENLRKKFASKNK